MGADLTVPDSYTKAEIEGLKTSIIDKKEEAVCPRCGGIFEQRAIGGGGSISTIIEYRCETCDRKIALSDFLV